MDTDFHVRYYRATRGNRLHAEFCRHVFGIDLRQHGFADARMGDSKGIIEAVEGGLHRRYLYPAWAA